MFHCDDRLIVRSNPANPTDEETGRIQERMVADRKDLRSDS
jgi:hypothetical protein